MMIISQSTIHKSSVVVFLIQIFLFSHLLQITLSQSLHKPSSLEHTLEDITDFFPSSISKIIGGSEVNVINKYPWFSLLLQRNLTSRLFQLHGCGATLVTREFVLTAAHCIDTNPDTGTFPSHVGIGVLTRQSGNKGQKLEIKKIQQTFIRPSYNETNFNNDIALIKITSPSTITPMKMDDSGISVGYTTGCILF